MRMHSWGTGLAAAALLAGCAAGGAPEPSSPDAAVPAGAGQSVTTIIAPYRMSSAEMRADPPLLARMSRHGTRFVETCASRVWRHWGRVEHVALSGGRSVQVSRKGEGLLALIDIAPRGRGSDIKGYGADAPDVTPQALLGALKPCL